MIPDYNAILNKIIEDIKIKLSNANTESIEVQLQVREESRKVPER